MSGLPDSLAVFEALHRLRRGQRLTRSLSKIDGVFEVARALHAGRLACFVIYDPQSEPELAARLTELQHHVARTVGSGFVFLVAVDPANSSGVVDLVGHAQGAPTMLPGGNLGFEPLASLDPSSTARALSMLFGVPLGMGPTLVVVESLWATGGWMIATSPSALGSQIALLANRPWLDGDLLGRNVRRDQPPGRADAIGAMLAPLSKEWGLPLVAREWGVPLDRLILAVLQSVAGERGFNTTLAGGPKRSSDARDPFGDLRRALRGDSEFAVEQASAACILEVKGRRQVIACPGGVVTAAMSERARIYLEQGDALCSIIDGSGLSTLDYRAPALHYALVAERELAEVLGHDVRQDLGVALPEYLWRVQPGLDPDSIDVGDGLPISFNRRHRNAEDGADCVWQPPTIGGLRKGWEHWFPSKSRAGFKKFIERWNSIGYRRNPLAHPGDEIPRSYASELRADVAELIQMIPQWRP